ncbi:HupE/UreJ family protein [Taibaiella chishuiensis]|uniref:HupE/UreJ protein n=1 Tax=Taibaiella chishuiensis TaxID=1434707 RepID=A0A2P8D8S1_9BACT|nr:HupE/UreJ family protein [Taibaiella chishuiensis]PSK93571.1 HupE/UreJ protein [Taibaiella chishuiensis]
MKRLCCITLLLSIAFAARAHVISYELDPIPGGQVLLQYLKLGYLHIIPLGLDHILFILCVFFLNNNLKQIVLQASMFTLAHSITLGLAMYGVIQPRASLVEPLIALSIVLLALENIWSRKVKPWRLVLVFLFGLVHGMGFAGALTELGMPSSAFLTALISFNIGVELGQLTIILLMYFLVARGFAHKDWYRKVIVIPASLLIAVVAGYWTIERIFYMG